MYQKQFLKTPRLTSAYYRAGEGNERKLLLLHGNTASSEVYLPFFPVLSARYDVIAPDLRCFGDTDALPIDATRGFRDWTDDLEELVSALGWERYAVCGWSMGGCITMQYVIEHGEKLTGVIVINPGSPFGFGGTRGECGEMLEPAGIASGAGCVTQDGIRVLAEKDREACRASIRATNFAHGFRLEPELEEMLIDAMLTTKIGEGMYPGDTRRSDQWPYVVAGDTGVCNTMSSAHGNLSGIADVPVKPPILWIRGAQDVMVSDTSICDLGYLGQAGLVPGWPGADVVSPQPMVAQTRYVFNQYAKNGGTYRELVLSGGHGCHLEHPEEFTAAVTELLG